MNDIASEVKSFEGAARTHREYLPPVTKLRAPMLADTRTGCTNGVSIPTYSLNKFRLLYYYKFYYYASFNSTPQQKLNRSHENEKSTIQSGYKKFYIYVECLTLK